MTQNLLRKIGKIAEVGTTIDRGLVKLLHNLTTETSNPLRNKNEYKIRAYTIVVGRATSKPTGTWGNSAYRLLRPVLKVNI